MMQKGLKTFWTNQRGFTLTDLIIALCITGLISLGASMSIVHIMKATSYNRNHMTVIEQVQNVGYWISRDARMAQSVELGVNLGFPLTLTWTEFGVGGYEHEIVYAIIGSGLERRVYINRDANPSATAITGIAHHVDLSETSCELNSNMLTLNIAAKTGIGPEEANVTRKYEIFCTLLIPQ